MHPHAQQGKPSACYWPLLPWPLLRAVADHCLREFYPDLISRPSSPPSKRSGRIKSFAADESELENSGYNVSRRTIAPVDIGVPEKRQRLYLVALRRGVEQSFRWLGLSTSPDLLKARLFGALEPAPERAAP